MLHLKINQHVFAALCILDQFNMYYNIVMFCLCTVVCLFVKLLFVSVYSSCLQKRKYSEVGGKTQRKPSQPRSLTNEVKMDKGTFVKTARHTCKLGAAGVFDICMLTINQAWSNILSYPLML